MYKTINNLSPALMKYIFPKREIPYNLRNRTLFSPEMSPLSTTAPKHFLSEVLKLGQWFQKTLRIRIRLQNLKPKSGIGSQKTVCADCAKHM